MNELDGGGWQSQLIGAEGSVPLMYQRERATCAGHARATFVSIYIYI
jgi:hypothetical protein